MAPSELRESIALALEYSVSKTKTLLKSGASYVGVFKSGSCGSYSVIDIVMDLEDDDPTSSKIWWTGDSYVTSTKNVHLMFCMVDGWNFVKKANKTYAVLALDGGALSGDNVIQRYFDNEDEDNENKAYKDGVLIASASDPEYIGNCIMGSDSKLVFVYFPQGGTDTSPFPYFSGISSYGVLGTFGFYAGSIHTDDEDDNNANWLQTWIWNPSTYKHVITTYYSGTSPVPTLFSEIGGNTTLKISKAY
jgi:hypothetical protein